jgi:hypothetical protein
MLFAAATIYIDLVTATDTASAGCFRLATETPPAFWATAAAQVVRERTTGTRQRFFAVVWAAVLADAIGYLIAAQQPAPPFMLDELFGRRGASIKAA